MGSDMVVALPTATVEGVSLFGQNCTRPASQGIALRRETGRAHAPDESVNLRNVTVPQARRTFTVLGVQAADEGGFLGGVNEQAVAIGQTAIRTRLAAPRPGLTGSELVRLVLERSGSARQAVDCLTDLVTRHGQGCDGDDHAFLIADGREAYAVETAGTHWAVQEIGAVRAVSAACMLRQDWNHVSPGLADLVISRNWWPNDGSKLDFAGAVAPEAADQGALRRWGQATLHLEQQNGRLDLNGLRRLLSDQHDNGIAATPRDVQTMERMLCRNPLDANGPATVASLLVESNAAELPALAWFAFGPPAWGLYFPIFLEAELPGAFQSTAPEQGCLLWQRMMQLATEPGDAERQATLREALGSLQARFDHYAKETLLEAAALKKQGDHSGLHGLLSSFMQANVECFEEVWTAQAEESTAEPAAPERGTLLDVGSSWETYSA